ncbi:hypothetical protein ACIQU5_17690 [Streptomyces sp. NPDC090306]|uniref:hypothetical protein n=1 Tax=Streptomyces sp. NPDC090306 TaxID=3365961 RepID=UPI0037FBB298
MVIFCPRRTAVAAAACGVLVGLLSACGATNAPGDDNGRAPGGSSPSAGGARATAPGAAGTTRIPGVGDRLGGRVPTDSRQVLAVYGDGKDSAHSTAVLYTRGAAKSGGAARDGRWRPARSWDAHNGRRGWTLDHHENDKRSPVGVFTLSDAGGVLPAPAADPAAGSSLPYTRSAAFAAPHGWPRAYWHDFDYVIAIDYNRVRGTAPNDPVRPQGQDKGGGIWLHMDHGSGTSACVSLPEPAMAYLLRTLDPKLHPVVVMGDRADLGAAA